MWVKGKGEIETFVKIEMKTFIGLHRLVNQMDRRSQKIFKEYGLTMGQFAVLEALYHKGSLTIGQVQEKILSSSGTMPLIIGNLEKRGLISRTPSLEDRRKCYLTISREGRDLISQVYPKNEKEILNQMRCWTREEKETLYKLLKKYQESKIN